MRIIIFLISTISIVNCINDVFLTSFIEQQVTLTCKINLDQLNFSTSGDYKILWSKELKNNDDYEPLYIDDTPLIHDSRILANRFLINKSNQQQIEWNLIIYNLKLNDSGHYVCQLNVPPYDSQGLKRFHLEVYGMYLLIRSHLIKTHFIIFIKLHQHLLMTIN